MEHISYNMGLCLINKDQKLSFTLAGSHFYIPTYSNFQALRKRYRTV